MFDEIATRPRGGKLHEKCSERQINRWPEMRNLRVRPPQ